MKKIVLLFIGLMLLVPAADSAVVRRVVTSTPNPYSVYNYGGNSFGFGTNNYPRTYYNNYNRGYNNFNNGFNNSSYYNRPARRYYKPQRPYYRYNNRPTYYNNRYRYRGEADKNVINVAYSNKNDVSLEYPKITQAEKTILGRTYEHQDIDLRLNRLEKSVFNKTYPAMSYDQRVNNIIVNFNSNSTSDVNLNNLSKIENKVLGRNYAFDTPKKRIERIEEQMFGAVQSGNVEERFETIKHASKSYKSYTAQNYQAPYSPCYQDQGQPYYTPPVVSGGGFRSMIGSLGNFMFGGYPTGFTPQMDPAYMDYFEAERAMQGAGSGEDIDVRSNTGYYKSNTQRQSGMGVTMLD